MPFRRYAQPNVGQWKPDHEGFDQSRDRLLVTTSEHERIVLAWSGADSSTGGLILDREGMPTNIARYFADQLVPFEYSPGEFTQPELFVYQQQDMGLLFELGHPRYTAGFMTIGSVIGIRAVSRSPRRSSVSLAGYPTPLLVRVK